MKKQVKRMWTRKQMLSFAEHCMRELVSKKRGKNSMSEIESYDLYKIKKILSEY